MKKAPAAAAPKGRPIRRSPPRAVAPRDASAPDYSRTQLDAIPLAGLPLYVNGGGVVPIGEALWSKGMPLGTVKSHLRRAFLRLQGQMVDAP